MISNNHEHLWGFISCKVLLSQFSFYFISWLLGIPNNLGINNLLLLIFQVCYHFSFTMPFIDDKSLIFTYSNNKLPLNPIIYSFVVLSLTVKFNPFCVYFCIWCETVVQFDPFAWSCSVFPIPSIEEVVFSSLYILASLS